MNIMFGALVKVVGGDAAQRKDAAQRFANHNKRELGTESKWLPLYGDDYVAYHSPADDAAEKERVSELLFRHQMIMGMAYRDTRGVSDPAARQQIIDDHFDRYDFRIKPLLENSSEWNFGDILDVVGPGKNEQETES